VLERHDALGRFCVSILRPSSQMVTVSSMLPIGFSSTRRRAPTPLVWSPMALVARRPLQWLPRFGKSANSAHTESVDAAMRRCTLM
jgi:hypothetical protein